MERRIEKVSFPTSKQPKVERVAAYARVSSGKDAMLHSLFAQVTYYRDRIEHHPGWLLAGIYADEDFTGTRSDRNEFQKMLEDCRGGYIDRIITKSISRFARNTVTLLETVRELKKLGIDIYFEEQNIHTLSSGGELMMTILASFAQEESRSVSENQKWRVRRNFEKGLPWNCTILGYRFNGEQFVIEPEEAAIVRRIFQEYLDGKGTSKIAKELNEECVPTRKGNEWHQGTVQKMLRNEVYTGQLLLQTSFCESYLTKKMVPNKGELPMYKVEDAHEPIIDRDTFEQVRELMQKKARPSKPKSTYPFTSIIKCGNCGKKYRRKMTAAGPVWICSTFSKKGKKYCISKQIPERVLFDATINTDLKQIEEITALNGNTMLLHFKDGSVQERQWKDRSRAESWTPEKRAVARQKALQRRNGAECKGQ